MIGGWLVGGWLVVGGVNKLFTIIVAVKAIRRDTMVAAIQDTIIFQFLTLT